MIGLGDRVGDRVTGFEGIVIARCEYLFGTTRVLVQAEEVNEGKVVAEWFDELAVSIHMSQVVRVVDGG